MNVLINLHRGYGLGDAVQMSAVLRHVAKHRPGWTVDYQAELGKHSVGRGIVHSTFPYGAPYTKHYDAEVQILLFDTWANWHDRPNTRVSSCLHERFDMGWDEECGRYRVDVSPAADYIAQQWTLPNCVALHYKGDSDPDRKDLTHEEAARICNGIVSLDHFPLLLDWRNKSPLVSKPGTVSVGKLEWALDYGRDAEMNCAFIRQCRAFVGIDSGPSKCASATDTPALVVWTGHHPAPFHDPAPNTTHLVPMGYHGLAPVCDDPGVVAWFEAHHNVLMYRDDPVPEVLEWLKRTLYSA